ncbi:DGQHR domain-containing protein [Vibrio sp. CDRSL-10 TSBA]
MSFFVGKMKAQDLLDISYSDVRRLENEERDVEKYLGIQRPLKKNRVKEINSYINTVDATFPNSVILSIDIENIYWNGDELVIEYDEDEKNNIAKVLDGQHRLAGFDSNNTKFIDYEGNKKDFEVLVTIFVNADMAVQAKVFSMVNQNQTKVNKSLVFDLESLAQSRSPWKTCHSIAAYVNEKDGSPFFHRIKRLGVKTYLDEFQPLTQAAFVDNLVKLITPNAQIDRNIILGKDKGFLGFASKKMPHMDTDSLYKFPFRKSFVDDEDEVILRTVYRYFEAVESVWGVAWNKNNSSSVLNKTVGLISMLRLLGFILSTLLLDDKIDFKFEISKNEFEDLLISSGIENEYFCSLDATSKTSVAMYNEVREKINLSNFRTR